MAPKTRASKRKQADTAPLAKTRASVKVSNKDKTPSAETGVSVEDTLKKTAVSMEEDTLKEKTPLAEGEENAVSREQADTAPLAKTRASKTRASKTRASVKVSNKDKTPSAETGEDTLKKTAVSDTLKKKTPLAEGEENAVSREQADTVQENTPLAGTGVSMEEDTLNEKTPETAVNIAKEKTLSVDGSSSNNSVGGGSESPNPNKTPSSKAGEKPVDNPQQDTTIAVQDVSVDLTECFKTDKVFDTREAVIQWCQELGRKNNTVLVITKSNTKPAGKGSIVELGCERGGVHKNHKRKDYKPKTGLKRKRAPNTKKCGCPFSLRSLCTAGNKWNLKVKCGRHNHEVENALTEHALAKRLKEDEEQLLARLTTSGLRPQQVLKVLKERNKENHSTIRTIYNARAKLRMLETEGKSVMQQILKLSTQYHYMEWHRKDEETNELKDIVWSHPESTLLAKCFPSVLMVDYMCKTNRFKMPYFNVLGVTSTGISFIIAYVFMEEETEEHLSWVLTQLKSLFLPDNLPSVFVTFGDPPLVNAIGAVFPGANRLVCTSHINQNIVVNCKNAFEDDNIWNEFYHDWEHVLKAQSEEDYVDKYAQFVETWKTRALRVVQTYVIHG
ncbi:hypothetical protein MKW94_014984 [Papaver nudicaule]|uniref:MULE transposase domain-containing protein n=1 Tax=Papaver nudicaule TaxID=74823 RepID=A0AA41RVM5_PAPNU|nr:hypothetical protein [Papaver nudicaule]